ncbi:DEAD/DEAH box helicase [Catenulispora pinisilvae]|uniref:DEAD/DEAH box helicase n=1 Tax=Catenulispora pinisilvae TaxID=2705253 RepID=UPI00189236F8
MPPTPPYQQNPGTGGVSTPEPAPDGAIPESGVIAGPHHQTLERLISVPASRAERVTHVRVVPARDAEHAEWPEWVDEAVVHGFRERGGVPRPWRHQVAAAEAARAGRHVTLATGTASGKSMGFQLPALTAIRENAGTTLYLAPTKALAADQLRRLTRLDVPGVRAGLLDGDTDGEARDWVRQHANYVLSNPDMLHYSLLPGHARWALFLRKLRYVVIDECHTYKGVFGSHVAAVLRRLRRICARYGSSPTFILASATTADPAISASRLTGLDVSAVTDDSSPRGPLVFALWEPPLTTFIGEHGAPVRRSATAEAADLLTDLVLDDVRTVVFTRSRRGAEQVSMQTRDYLEERHRGYGNRIAAYRGGYLKTERRALEAALHMDPTQDGALVGLAATTALELGVDVAGLDAVLMAGFPGTRASLWQQAGRAGRAGQGALAVLIARDDPLDTYLVHHSESIFDRPVEAAVLDPDNPYVLAPHLCAAAAELPITDSDLSLFGPTAEALLTDLTRREYLRRRPTGWYWTRRERPSALTDLRGTGGPSVRIVEDKTGRLLGTVDEGASHSTVHDGAVYLHQSHTYLVDKLNLEQNIALVHRADPDYTTMARDVVQVTILETEQTQDWGDASLHFGSVEVSTQVVSYLKRKAGTGQIIETKPLDLPERILRTRAVWWTVDPAALREAELDAAMSAGAAHAAEHASIGLLPLFTPCDRWDIGGVSMPMHPDTERLTVFVYDGHPGGAGFAERAYGSAAAWLTATRDVIAACECLEGCPSCVQSPKCGNGNNPLDKAGAARLLNLVLSSVSNTESDG